MRDLPIPPPPEHDVDECVDKCEDKRHAGEAERREPQPDAGGRKTRPLRARPHAKSGEPHERNEPEPDAEWSHGSAGGREVCHCAGRSSRRQDE